MLDYNEISIYSKKRTPYFTGVQENGSVAIITLSSKSYDELVDKYKVKYYESPTIHIYENEKIALCNSVYDYGNEEYVETIKYVFEGKKKEKLIKDLNTMLNLNWLCNKKGVIAANYQDLLGRIKSNKDYIMII